MIQIPDDPIIRTMERTGWPPWLCSGDEDEKNNDTKEINNG